MCFLVNKRVKFPGKAGETQRPFGLIELPFKPNPTSGTVHFVAGKFEKIVSHRKMRNSYRSHTISEKDHEERERLRGDRFHREVSQKHRLQHHRLLHFEREVQHVEAQKRGEDVVPVR